MERNDNATATAPFTTERSMIEQSFLNGALSSLTMIVTSELLDKSFFIAVVMAMRYPRLIVYCGVVSALALMTVLSATAGLLTAFIPRWITVYASSALMLLFGLKMTIILPFRFYDAFRMKSTVKREELEEKAIEENESDHLIDDSNISTKRSSVQSLPRIFAETFALTFIAEWGDRSQLATVLLAATDNFLGVIVGGVAGHAVCSGAAVLGGRCIASHVSVRIVTVIGGFVFLIFAVLSIIMYNINPSA